MVATSRNLGYYSINLAWLQHYDQTNPLLKEGECVWWVCSNKEVAIGALLASIKHTKPIAFIADRDHFLNDNDTMEVDDGEFSIPNDVIASMIENSNGNTYHVPLERQAANDLDDENRNIPKHVAYFIEVDQITEIRNKLKHGLALWGVVDHTSAKAFAKKYSELSQQHLVPSEVKMLVLGYINNMDIELPDEYFEYMALVNEVNFVLSYSAYHAQTTIDCVLSSQNGYDGSIYHVNLSLDLDDLIDALY